jgi:hypothetical protein
MPFTAYKMGAHPKPASATHSKCHFTHTMRKTASSCFKTVYSMTYGYELPSIVDYRGKSKGNQRDVVWDGAFKIFVFGQSEHESNALPRKKTFEYYEDLVLRCCDAWDRGLDSVRASHRGAHVTYDQLLQLATVLATGREGVDGSWSHNQSIRVARDECEELSSKNDNYKLTESTLRHV